MLLASIMAVFLAAVLAPALVRRWGCRGGLWLTLLPLGLATYYLFLASGGTAVQRAQFLPWVPSLGLNLAFSADGLGLLFGVLISGIGAVVVAYASGYFAHDARLSRFYGWLFLFMGAMLGVVFSDNLLVLYIFWEITSVSSYMLIGFDHENPVARTSALQALMVTVLGGVCMLAGAVMLGIAGASMEISTLLTRRELMQADPLFIPALILILVGAFTKSAQFPFHFWLPNAMAAPAPVSAYLHSAAMVKAGIFLLLRLSPLLGGNEIWTWGVGLTGAVTLVFGAFMAFSQTDLKLLLAYSTVSALGMMTLLIGLGNPGAIAAALVLVVAHALYKGALFLAAGAIDHGAGSRDVRQLGGLFASMPRTAVATAVAALSMGGVLPLFGAIAKEMGYEASLEYGLASAAAATVGGLAFFFVAASIGYGPFWQKPVGEVLNAHEAPVSMQAGIAALAGLGLILGLWPQSAAKLFLEASADVSGAGAGMNLHLWHGWTPALMLSIGTLALGTVLYWMRIRVRSAAARMVIPWGPDAAYDRGLRGTMEVAEAAARLLQSGRLRNYIIIIVVTLTGLAAVPLVAYPGLRWPGIGADFRYSEIGIAVMILVAAFLAIRARSLLGAIAAMGAVGYAVAAIYMTFSAPDLAMTQFLIESLTVLIFALAFYRLPRFENLSSRASRMRHAAVALLGGGLITTLVLVATGLQLQHPISEFFVDASVREAHGHNVVNVILVDFRGLDTLGEATVLGIAAIGVYGLIKMKQRKRD